MYTVHIRCHDDETQQPVEGQGEFEVAVAEHGGTVKDNFKNQNGKGRRSEEIDDPELDDHREDDLQRVKTDPGGEIEIQIAVVNHVEPPQRGCEVKEDMLEVDEKIEDDNARDDGQPVGDLDTVEETPASLRRDQGKSYRHQGENDANDQSADGHDTEVIKPAHRFGRCQESAGHPAFQEGKRKQRSEKKPQPDDGLVFKHDLP